MAKYQIDKIGILGGSFDPPHKGHLTISKIATRKAKLKKVYWIITKKNPFKKRTLFSLKDRLSKAQKITKNFKNIKVLYLEDKIKSTRSINTIIYFLKKKKPKNLYFIVGSDILSKFHKWYRWKKIVKLVKLIVLSRKGYDRKGIESTVVKYLKKDNIIFANNKHVRISSTILRRKIRKTN